MPWLRLVIQISNFCYKPPMNNGTELKAFFIALPKGHILLKKTEPQKKQFGNKKCSKNILKDYNR